MHCSHSCAHFTERRSVCYWNSVVTFVKFASCVCPLIFTPSQHFVTDEHQTVFFTELSKQWRCGSWPRLCATSRKVAGSIELLQFVIVLILPAVLWRWVRLSLWQKWVPWIFHGGKDGWNVGLTFLHSCAPLSWNLGASNSWQPQGLL